MASTALFSLGTRAMAASYAALQTTGNNIANANTRGYSRQQVELATSGGQFTGAGFFGKGVDVRTVSRAHDLFLTREAALTQSIAEADGARLSQLQQLEKLFGLGESGLGHLARQLIDAFVDVASRPQDSAARQVALSRAEDTAARFRATGEQIDALQLEVEEKVLRMFALRQPMAVDLRHAMSAMKISMQLERCGDLAKNIAKRGLVLAKGEPVTPFNRSIDRMGKLVGERLKAVLDAYAAKDVAAAVDVWNRDEEVDEHYNAIFRELLTYMMGDPRTITPCTHLLFVAKNLERIGDHATNIAEIVHYEFTGDAILGLRPKFDTLQQD